MLYSLSHLFLLGLVSALWLAPVEAQFKPRKDNKWDKLYEQSKCLNYENKPLFKVGKYNATLGVNITEGWISNKTGEATVNPYFVNPKTGERLPNHPMLGFDQLNGEGRCPDQLSYRWSRDISWTRSTGEKVTVTIQRTHKCKDTQPNELFTKQKVFVNVSPKSAKNSNLSSREEDAIIAEGIQSINLEAEARLNATELDYSAAKIKDVRGVYEADKALKAYVDPGGCAQNGRNLTQANAEIRFCAAREAALKKVLGGKLTEKDAICPELAPRSTQERLAASSAARLECGRTYVSPSENEPNGERSKKVEVSYCPLKPSYASVKVGDTDGKCEVKDKTQYEVVIRCLSGSVPRVPGLAPTAPAQPTAASPNAAK